MGAPGQSLDDLATLIKVCTHCPLASERTRVVPGHGPPAAPILVVGESPSQHDDAEGKPLVGRAGVEFDLWLAEAGLERRHLFITTVLKCHGGRDNRFPQYKPEGPVDKCLGWLRQQIAALKPRAVLLLGKHALEHVLLPGSGLMASPVEPWVGPMFRRRDLFGDARVGIAWPPAHILRARNPIEKGNSIRVISALADYAKAKHYGRSAPSVPITDVQPAPPVIFQQRLKLFGGTS